MNPRARAELEETPPSVTHGVDVMCTSFVDASTRMASLFRSIAFAHHGYRHFLADARVDATFDPLPRARSSDASASSRARIVGSGSRWRARSSREGPPCTACVEITNEG